MNQAEECEKTGNKTPNKSQIPFFFFFPQLFVALPRPLPTQANPPLFPSHPKLFGIRSHPADVFPAG